MSPKERTHNFLSELGIPVIAFCRNVNISPTTYYDWQKGKMLSEATIERISKYLSRYGF